MRILAAVSFLIAAACGGSSSGTNAARIVLSSAGAAPSAVQIPNGGQVEFDNNDAARHRIASTDCAQLSSPELAQGQSFTSPAIGGPKSCTFSDALNPSSTIFRGSVTVNAPGTGGGGGSGY